MVMTVLIYPTKLLQTCSNFLNTSVRGRLMSQMLPLKKLKGVKRTLEITSAC